MQQPTTSQVLLPAYNPTTDGAEEQRRRRREAADAEARHKLASLAESEALTVVPRGELPVNIMNSMGIWNSPLLCRQVAGGTGKKGESFGRSGKIAVHLSFTTQQTAFISPWEEQRPYVVICSVWPGPLISGSNLFYHLYGRPVFCFEPVPMGEFRSMRIYGGVQILRDLTEQQNETMTVQDVAPGVIVGDWLRAAILGLPDASPESHIGAGIIGGDVPTDEEYERLVTAQRNWQRNLIANADKLYRSLNPQDRERISPEHIAALEASGDTDVTRHPWYTPYHIEATKTCPACGKTMESRSMKHGDPCNTDLIDWHLRYTVAGLMGAELEQELIALQKIDPPVASMVRRMASRRAAASGNQGGGSK